MLFTLTSKIIKYMTKTWLDNKIEELAMILTHSEQGFYAINEEYAKQFITDLRKHDEEELIKIINKDKLKQPEFNEGLYNSVKDEDIKLIKDYYEK